VSILARLRTSPILQSPEKFRSRSGLAMTVVGALAALLASSVAISAASAAEPAVKERNFRVMGSYDFIRVGSDRATGREGVVEDFPEEDIDLGIVLGIVTVPISHSFGARAFFGALGSKRHVDDQSERRIGGLEMGGDIFWRDQEIGEIGIGPRYTWRDVERGGSNQSGHNGGAAINGSLFLGDFGLGPMDIEMQASVLDSDVDIDRDGDLSPGRTYHFSGGVTAYLADNFSMGLAGSYTRENAGNGEHLVTTGADIDARLLLPMRPAVTLGASVSGGRQDVAVNGFSNYGVDFYSIGVSVEVSFPGADSLLELNRNFY
jgi:hypothetical protein